MLTVKGYAKAAALVSVAFALTGTLPACAKEAPLYRGASIGGVERRSTLELQGDGDQSARNVQLVRAMAQIDAYQQMAGKLGQTMGANFSVKRLGMAMQDDHDRIDDMLHAAIGEAQIPADQAAAMPADLSLRLDALYRVPAKDFDRAYLANEIQTSREGLAAIGAYQSNDLDAPAREALAMLTQQLEDRILQATTLQRDLG